MDYNALLDISIELGYRLAMNGAETYRIEESVKKVLGTYGISAETFAIPNCLHVSIETSDGNPITRMRRIGYHGNDLDAVEKYSNLSRKICSECPPPDLALQWLEETEASRRYHSPLIYLLGNFLGACGFCVLLNGSLTDSIFAGVCGVVVGVVNKLMDKMKANPFFRTIAAAFLMALVAYVVAAVRTAQNTDSVIIGALMILVPGLIFTNAMRDIIYGDTNSGINRIVQVFLIAAAIALGTGAAWTLSNSIFGDTGVTNNSIHSLCLEAIACFVGCFGFTILFNIHGNGRYLCAGGGMLTWIVYRIVFNVTQDTLAAYFWGTVFASLYAEIMARIRKYPAISYLVISAFPLIPGAGLYRTMIYAAKGNMTDFARVGMETAAIAGIMAAGILLASTAVRIINNNMNQTTK